MSNRAWGSAFGKPEKKSVSIRSFSLTQENSRYLDGVNKGHKSEVVNRALNLYRNDPERVDLIENIGALQQIILNLHQEIDEITSAGQVPDDEAQKVPPSRGLKRFFKFLWP